jgi:hypothetical protein
MEVYVQTIVGVVVSVVLFLVGYRQTVGARRERARAANTDIERTLLRRIVLESYTPTLEEIARLVDGKARDYRVNPTELLSEAQILNTLFTRMLESDFLTAEQRREVVGRVSPALQKAEGAEVREPRVLELVSVRQRVGATRIVALLGVTASAIGVLVSTSAATTQGDHVLWPVLAAFAGSLVAIGTIAMAYRFRESQEEPGREAALVSAVEFEKEVWRVLRKTGAGPAGRPGEEGYDFAAQLAGKKVLIAVKAWSRRPPLQLLRLTLGRLRQAVESQAADEGILLMRNPPDIPIPDLEGGGVRVMTLRQLRDYVAHSAP